MVDGVIQGAAVVGGWVARGGRPALSVVVPMFNEVERIGGTLADVCAVLDGWGIDAEVLLVDDGSTDGTAVVAEGLCGPRARVLQLSVNRGKGAAVRAGMLAARGAWVLFMDADNATRLTEFARLGRGAAVSGAPIVIGSRATAGSEAVTTLRRRLAGGAFRLCLGVLGLRLARDTQCGFKAYRADAAAYIAGQSVEDGFAFDVEHLLIAQRAGIAVHEVGVRWDHQSGGSIRVVRDGVRMLRAAAAIRRRVMRADLPRFVAGERAAPAWALAEVKPVVAAVGSPVGVGP